MARRKSPKVLAAVLILTSVAALSYKIYGAIQRQSNTEEAGKSKENSGKRKRAQYASKQIAVTLLHSVLSLGLPLDEILLSSENVTFILPPYLSVDDLACQIESSVDSRVYELPQTLIRNYKLLRCSNIDGYFHLLKNLRPDMLFVCTDDLGIRGREPPDLGRFVKEIVTFDQDKDDVYSVLSEVFLE